MEVFDKVLFYCLIMEDNPDKFIRLIDSHGALKTLKLGIERSQKLSKLISNRDVPIGKIIEFPKKIN